MRVLPKTGPVTVYEADDGTRFAVSDLLETVYRGGRGGGWSRRAPVAPVSHGASRCSTCNEAGHNSRTCERAHAVDAAQGVARPFWVHMKIARAMVHVAELLQRKHRKEPT